MRERFSGSMISVAIAGAAVSVVISVSITPASAQAPVAPAAAPAPMLTTPWGEPDLQGIWTDETDTPLQRSPKYAHQEFFTEAQRAELDRQRSAMMGRERRAERGTTADVAGAYNDVFTPKKRTGARTSRIVDPPNGRLPPLTPEAQKSAAAEREFRLVLLQATETCKNNQLPCRGGKYDPTPSPRFVTYSNRPSRLGYSPCVPTPVLMKPISLKLSPSMTNTPFAFMSATKKIFPSGETRMSCGMPPLDSLR